MNNDPAARTGPALTQGAEPGPGPLVPAEISQPGAYEEEEVIAQPAKLMRIASMAKQLLEEVRWPPRSTTPAARG